MFFFIVTKVQKTQHGIQYIQGFNMEYKSLTKSTCMYFQYTLGSLVDKLHYISVVDAKALGGLVLCHWFQASISLCGTSL